MATLHRGSGSGGAFSVPGITGGQAVRRNAANTGWEGYTPTGGSYTLPAATDSVLGGVKVGDRLTMSNSGVLSADVQAYTLPEAGSALGGIKTGGPLTLSAGTATINDGAITAGMIASGVIPSVPQKATAQEVAEGNDSKFITAAQAKSITQSVEDGAEWSGFSFVSGTPTAGQFGITGTNATGWVFTFATTDANATAMDRTFGENSSFRVVKDATNKIEGETQYAWRSGNSVSMKLKPNATETGDIRSGSATLHGTGGLYEALKDQGFLENTDLREGSNITLTTSGNQVTISASGGGGGSGPSKASQAEVLAGTDDTKFVTPLRAHDLVDHLAHVERVTGLQNATSPNDLPTGRWHINSGGTTAYFRAHTATEHAALVREMLVDRQFVLVNAAGQRIEATFSAVQVNAVSGSDIGIIQCTIGSHSATPASPALAGDWTLYVLPQQNEWMFNSAPKGSIPHAALALDLRALAKGLAATGGSTIGTTTFGQVNDFSNLEAAGLLPIPHPDQAGTPTGTGVIAMTPQSASSKFKCEFDVGWGWTNSDGRYQISMGLIRKIGNGNWALVHQKTNIINATGINGNDVHTAGFYLDSPNTTEEVKYKWLAARRQSTERRIYPVAQSVAVTEIPG